MESRGKRMVSLALQNTGKAEVQIIDRCNNNNDVNVNSYEIEVEQSDTHQQEDFDFDNDDVDGDLDFVPDDKSSSDSPEEVNLPIQKRNRWNKADPESWLYNVEKKKRSLGQTYVSKNSIVPAKSPKPIDCSKCYYKCTDSFTNNERTNICREYWRIGDYNRKKDFILRSITCNEPARQRPRGENSRHRKRAIKFFFLKNESSVRVCRNFFLKTLSINDGPLRSAVKGANLVTGTFGGSDKRGRHAPGIKTTEADKIAVNKHIERFPVMESHFCRKSSQRKYLDSQLTIAKMHELYHNEMIAENRKAVSLTTYRRIFAREYNLSFFKPKKDQCAVCAKYFFAKNDSKQELEAEYFMHKEREKEALSSKAKDKELASREKSFVTATFDLQSVLQIPCSDVSPMYYSRKLCCYNLTIYEGAAPNNAYCYAWTEINGKRGSAEIGTCLYKYLHQLPEYVKSVSLFSDTCGGQNRNQNVAAILLYCLQEDSIHIQEIEQKFLESGHSMMECDSMHSAIESQKKYASVYTMHDWLNIFRLARSKRGKKKNSEYKVTELRSNEFLNISSIAKTTLKNLNVDTEGRKVNWLKVKSFKYLKGCPGTLQYRYDHHSPYATIIVSGRGRPKKVKIETLRNEPLPISSQKKRDLLRLCESGVIPEEFHGWYKSLPVSTLPLVDRIPEAAVESSNDEEEL